MWILLLVPFVLLGLCAVAAVLVGGSADRYVEAQRGSRLYHLPGRAAVVSSSDANASRNARASG